MFIVTMMMTVLATVGLFALAAASTEVKTAGNERQSTQTHYLAEYGIIAMAHNADGPHSTAYLIRMTQNQVCQSLPIPPNAAMPSVLDPASLSCGLFDMVDFQTTGNWLMPPTVTYTGAPYSTSVTTPGSLGPVPTTPGFAVELTDSNTAMAPGNSLGSNSPVKFVMVTATAIGVTLPSFGAAASYANEGIEIQRARIVAGPLPQ